MNLISIFLLKWKPSWEDSVNGSLSWHGKWVLKGYDNIEEVTQEVFARTYQALATFQNKSPFTHWLSTKEGIMKEHVRFTVNGKPVTVTVDGNRPLLWVVRTDLGLTGAKYGCGKGLCGACTILVDNTAVRSCVMPVKSVNGRNVITIEGLAHNGRLHPLQKAFMEHDALQCGFCTPGMILTAYSFLQTHAQPTYADIVQQMDQNLCRCGAHTRIIRAIQAAANEMKGGRT
jgi:aerobic-type carbon monoxide dehydrogenase small subunit (CoxS/CutS family)